MHVAGLQAVGDVAAVAAEEQDRDRADHHGEQRRQRAAAVAQQVAQGERQGLHARLLRLRAARCRSMRPSRIITASSAAASTFGIVRGEHERDVVLALHVAHQRDDRRAGVAVQVRGRLVGQHQLRRRAPARARWRRAGAARRRAAPEGVRALSARPTASSSVATRRLRSAAGTRASSSGYSTFSSTVSTGSRLKFWKMKPRWRARKSDSASSDSVCTASPATRDLAAVGLVDAADQVEQRGLAAARGPGDDGEAVRADLQVDVDQRRDTRPRRGDRSCRHVCSVTTFMDVPGLGVGMARS